MHHQHSLAVWLLLIRKLLLLLWLLLQSDSGRYLLISHFTTSQIEKKKKIAVRYHHRRRGSCTRKINVSLYKLAAGICQVVIYSGPSDGARSCAGDIGDNVLSTVIRNDNREKVLAW